MLTLFEQALGNGLEFSYQAKRGRENRSVHGTEWWAEMTSTWDSQMLELQGLGEKQIIPERGCEGALFIGTLE